MQRSLGTIPDTIRVNHSTTIDIRGAWYKSMPMSLMCFADHMKAVAFKYVASRLFEDATVARSFGARRSRTLSSTPGLCDRVAL